MRKRHGFVWILYRWFMFAQTLHGKEKTWLNFLISYRNKYELTKKESQQEIHKILVKMQIHKFFLTV